MLFKFFEKSVPCYPSNEPALPPRGFLAFVWACARGVRGYVVAMAGLSALIAVYEALLFAVLGRVVDWEGSINWKGQELRGKKAYEIAHLGLGYVPESRDVFPNLTVHQNLMLGQKGNGKNSRWSFDDMYQMFPRLKERQHTEAGVMSGGEQQMLTLCRTLMGDPDLIIIDEPTEGLAPKIVELVGQYLKKIKERGVSVLLIEQKLTIAMDISDRTLVMGHGSIVFQGTPDELRANSYVRKEWLEV